MRSIWVDNSPESLFKLSAKFCLSNPDILSETTTEGRRRLRDGLYLPVEISEALFQICQEESIIDNSFCSIFDDTGRTKLSQLIIHNGVSLTNPYFQDLLRHNLKKISLNNCRHLNNTSLESINEFSDNLLSLFVDNTENLFPDHLCMQPDDDCPPVDEDDDDVLEEESEYERRRYILRAPRLKHLTLRGLNVMQGRNYFNILCKALPNLTHLDLSCCNSSTGLMRLQFLLNCPHLVSLVLYNVKEVKHSLNTLCHLDRLEHLDISQMETHWMWTEIEAEHEFENPTRFLEQLVTSLQCLKSLDISGTNLVSEYSSVGGRPDGTLCDIPGLCSRIDSPLHFLGIYKTMNDEAGRRQHIPALVISGSYSEEQLIVAGKQYLDRPAMLENVLNDLINMVSHYNIDNIMAVTDITVAAVERFPRNSKILNMAVIMMFYLIPMVQTDLDNSSADQRPRYNVLVRRRLVGLILGIMERNKINDKLIKNCFMVIWKMAVPHDLMLLKERMVEMLLVTGEHYSNFVAQDLIQESSVVLLYSLVCHISGDSMKQVGLRIIDSMLTVIRIKLSQGLCDEIMETAWNVMWNATYETEENSLRFLDKGGIETLLECKDRFPESRWNMMEVLGNVVEVKSCRQRLMTAKFIEEFSFLLDSQKDGIEVSYNAAGVVSHLASDGQQSWTVETPEEIMCLRDWSEQSTGNNRITEGRLQHYYLL